MNQGFPSASPHSSRCDCFGFKTVLAFYDDEHGHGQFIENGELRTAPLCTAKEKCHTCGRVYLTRMPRYLEPPTP